LTCLSKNILKFILLSLHWIIKQLLVQSLWGVWYERLVLSTVKYNTYIYQHYLWRYNVLTMILQYDLIVFFSNKTVHSKILYIIICTFCWQIKIWFQNRRARERRDHSGSFSGSSCNPTNHSSQQRLPISSTSAFKPLMPSHSYVEGTDSSS